MSRILFCLVTALLASCFAKNEGWPKWASSLTTELKCGMSLDELNALTDQAVIVEEGARPWLGKHRINERHTDLWLQFGENGGLRSIILAQPDSFKTMRLSPRINLCSGESTFRLRIRLPEELLGAQAYVDGERAATLESLQEDLELPSGNHQVTIKKEGYEPLTRNFHLGLRDRGDQRLDLRSADLQPSLPSRQVGVI
jgi:hypothetical protein